MVYFDSSISVSKYVARSGTVMANSVDSNELFLKPRHGSQVNKSRKAGTCLNCMSLPVCDGSRSAMIDIVILIAVVCACGFLLFPSVKFLTVGLVEFATLIHYMVKDEVMSNPVLYGSIVISTFLSAIVAWLVILRLTSKCGNPNCKGLRKAAEFDIQLETEDCVKNSNSSAALVKDGGQRGFFELPRAHHRELEAELKKMAPPNGRAVLVFRARCGCSVGKLEVPGPKKQKKIKKELPTSGNTPSVIFRLNLFRDDGSPGSLQCGVNIVAELSDCVQI